MLTGPTHHSMVTLRLVVEKVLVKVLVKAREMVDLVEVQLIMPLLVLEQQVKVIMEELDLVVEVMPLVEVVVKVQLEEMLQIIPPVVMVETEVLG